MKPVEYKITLKPGKVSYQFDNLFDGQKELGDNINKVSLEILLVIIGMRRICFVLGAE